MNCDYCGGESPRGRFCCDKHRSAWHREHDPQGVIRSVRRLKDGGVAVIVHFKDREAERALHFHLKQSIVLGSVQS